MIIYFNYRNIRARRLMELKFNDYGGLLFDNGLNEEKRHGYCVNLHTRELCKFTQ